MEAQIATTTALLKASAFLVFILVRAAMDIFSHGVHIYIPVYHWDENSLWLPSPKVVVFSQKEASMLICGENVHSCCVQRRAQTHVKRFHTFACDAVGLKTPGVATTFHSRWPLLCAFFFCGHGPLVRAVGFRIPRGETCHVTVVSSTGGFRFGLGQGDQGDHQRPKWNPGWI